MENIIKLPNPLPLSIGPLKTIHGSTTCYYEDKFIYIRIKLNLFSGKCEVDQCFIKNDNLNNILYEPDKFLLFNKIYNADIFYSYNIINKVKKICYKNKSLIKIDYNIWKISLN